MQAPGTSKRLLQNALTVLASAFALCWPALLARYPIFSPDSLAYIEPGNSILKMLFGDHTLSRAYLRAELYCAVLYFFHWNITPWPILALNGLLTAWAVWLVARSLWPRRPLPYFLALIFGLCFFTTVSWSVALLSPDILGAILYLALYLVVFARETLRPWETAVLVFVAAWSVTAHPTHLAVALALIGFLALLWALRFPPLRGRGIQLLQAAGIVALGIAAQVASNARIFGKPTLFDPHPPFLTARIVADGPARDYLRDNCNHLQWTICQSVDRLPSDEDQFLWAVGGIYDTATPQQRAAMRAQEMPLVLATLRTYPRRQARRSWNNFVDQLLLFGLEPLTNDNPWMLGRMDIVFPGSRARFFLARPRLDALPRHTLRTLQTDGMALATVVCAILLPWVWWKRQNRLLGLTTVVVAILIANAAVTGILSGVAPRYEARVAWLLPMLAAFFLYALKNPPETSTPPGRTDA